LLQKFVASLGCLRSGVSRGIFSLKIVGRLTKNKISLKGLDVLLHLRIRKRHLSKQVMKCKKTIVVTNV